MHTKSIKDRICSGAARINELKAVLDDAVESRGKGEAQRARWSEAARAFREEYDALAFPGGWGDARERIVAGDAEAIEAGLCFLEMRPYFHRSGYMYDALIRKMKRAQLTKGQALRLKSFLKRLDEWRADRHS